MATHHVGQHYLVVEGGPVEEVLPVSSPDLAFALDDKLQAGETVRSALVALLVDTPGNAQEHTWLRDRVERLSSTGAGTPGDLFRVGDHNGDGLVDLFRMAETNPATHRWTRYLGQGVAWSSGSVILWDSGHEGVMYP